MIIIISGVSGVGKTTIGSFLADELGWYFYDADDFHSPANVAKMTFGKPLNDEDRREWLAKLHNLITESVLDQKSIVLACSALKQAHREYLCISDRVKIILLQADFATIENRLKLRENHFMSTDLLRSQFETLEPPAANLIILDASLSPESLVQQIISSIDS